MPKDDDLLAWQANQAIGQMTENVPLEQRAEYVELLLAGLLLLQSELRGREWVHGFLIAAQAQYQGEQGNG